MGKSKFKVGDKVRFKKSNSETTYTISHVEYDVADRRNKYKLSELPVTLFFCASDLEKL